MKCYGTDEYGNVYERQADKGPLGEDVCNARESFDRPPTIPEDKRGLVENQKWQIINLDKRLIKENGIIRSKTQVERYASGLDEIPKGMKLSEDKKELLPKTLDEQLSSGEITQTKYNEIYNQPVKYELNDIDIKSIRSLREWLVKQPDCPEFIKTYENQANAKRSELKK